MTKPTDDTVLSLLEKHFALKGALRNLPGEEDYNYYFHSTDGNEYTVKISRPNTEVANILFQGAILQHLSKKNTDLNLPEIIYAQSGEGFIFLENKSFLRLQKWVPGKMLSEVSYRSPELLQSWGATCAFLSKALEDFDHPTAHRFYKWNPSETLYSRTEFRAFIKDSQQLEVADYFWNLFEKEALPYLPRLRKSVNYNDAHEHNLLIAQKDFNVRVHGVIDFGDALYSETINELAIACAYAGMGAEDSLEAMSQVIWGYHQVFPILEEELEVLFPLITARLMITAASSAYNKVQEPENEYLLISEKPAWELLNKLRLIPSNFAKNTFRKACGLTPCKKEDYFNYWLKSAKDSFAQIIDFQNKEYTHLDLSIGSLSLGHNTNFDSNTAFTKTIKRILAEADAVIGIGGYLEARPVYTTDAYAEKGNYGRRWRTVHLGMDTWTEAGTPVYAPLDGIVHSFQDNNQDRDYGPTIVLQHQINEQFSFYTLYGHLSKTSLENLQQGAHVSKGQQIATLGNDSENGNWPPHLHFQILLDTLGNEGNFPGVCFPEESEVWKSICPDPAPFFPEVYTLNQQKSTNEILLTRQKHLGKSLSISYRKPLHIVRGYKQYLYDHTGRRFLDTVNNVAHVGHQHPHVVRAAQQQIGVLNTNTRYLHQNVTEFAKALLETFPPELSVVHFVNSGSEANELALRMARHWSNQKDMLAVEIGYHGNTGGTIDISSYKFDGKGGKGAPPHTHIVPMPDSYRGLHRNPETAGELYANEVVKIISQLQKEGKNIAGFIGESILSCGGQIVLPQGYLQKVYATVRAAGGLCIADEVQVGFGRVGDHFWGFELQNVIPDIVTMGKPIGNGHPLAAVVTTPAVAERFANGMEYFNTFGGNPVSTAVGKAVLEVVQQEGLQDHAKKMGKFLLDGFQELQTKFPIIGDVRGHGLFLGIELVRNRETLEAADLEAAYVANRMRERGVLMSTDGPLHNVLKIKPPMCFSEADGAFLLEELAGVLRAI